MQLQSSLFNRQEHMSERPAQQSQNGASPSRPVGSDVGAGQTLRSRHEGRYATTSATTEREGENDALMAALLSDLRGAKRGFARMGDEVRRHHTLLDSLTNSIQGVSSSLGATMRSLDSVGVTAVKHMWILFLFVVVFFVLLYAMLKLRR